MSVPDKYRALGDFHEYYSGARKAPVLTIFIGGNHEASAYGQELFYGGWVCPNIYYLGAANVLNIGGLRIAGLSGIYSAPDYHKTHYERLPYMGSAMRSAYHVRAYDVYKLYNVTGRVDIGLSHDWPQGMEHNGDMRWLLQEKPWFGSDIRNGELGSPPARSLLYKLRPKYWFSGHLHIKFAAIVHHTEGQPSGQKDLEETREDKGKVENPDAIDLDMSDTEKDANTKEQTVSTQNEDEIDLDLDEIDQPPAKRARSTPSTPAVTNQDEIDLDDDDTAVTTSVPAASKSSTSETISPTYFLALDKCLPNRAFLQILEIDTPTTPTPESRTALSYDPEWLAITRAFNSYLEVSDSTTQSSNSLPREADVVHSMIEKEKKWVEENVKDLRISPDSFVRTAPAIGAEGGPRDWRAVGQRECPFFLSRFMDMILIGTGNFQRRNIIIRKQGRFVRCCRLRTRYFQRRRRSATGIHVIAREGYVG